MPHPVSSLLRPCAVAATLIAAAGCMRPLALQHEYFAPLSGVAALATVRTTHTVSHHRALQAAQRACDFPALASAADPGPIPDPGPDPWHAGTLRALAATCADTVAATGSVAAHGAAANAFRRWEQDQVRELPAVSETAASAAGG